MAPPRLPSAYGLLPTAFCLLILGRLIPPSVCRAFLERRRRLAVLRRRGLLVPLGDRHPPAEAECAAGDLQPRRGLAALVLAAVDQPRHPLHRGGVEPFSDDVRHAFF